MYDIHDIVMESKQLYSNLGMVKRYLPTDKLRIITDRTSYLDVNCTIRERFYHIEHDIYQIPKCECGVNLSWGNKGKYNKYCSYKCSANNTKTKEMRMVTNLDRYGVTDNMKLDKFKNLRKITYMNNYGVDNPSKNVDIKQKKVDTCMKNHGVINGFLTPECKQAVVDKFGVYNVNYVPEIHERQQAYRWKEYILPSGKKIKVQGYEPRALDELLLIYNEEEIITSRKDIPAFRYIEKEKEHRYYPDMWIPKDNIIVEVKSEWTYKQYITKNLLKEQSVRDAGYNYKLIIYKKFC